MSSFLAFTYPARGAAGRGGCEIGWLTYGIEARSRVRVLGDATLSAPAMTPA